LKITKIAILQMLEKIKTADNKSLVNIVKKYIRENIRKGAKK